MSNFNLDKLQPKPFDIQQGIKTSILGRVQLENSIKVDVRTLAIERFTNGSYLKTADGRNEYILDENGRTILLFEGDGSGSFNSVYSPLTKEQLRRELLCLPEEQQRELEQRLSLPQASPADVEEYRKIHLGRETDKVLLGQILSLEPGFNSENRALSVDQNLIRGIIQTEYAITNKASDKPIIGTFGLGPCIAVAAYDVETSTTALVHIDPTTDIDSLGVIFDDMGIPPKEYGRLKVGLIGGEIYSSRAQVIVIVRYLQSKGITISYADILDKPHPSSFVIDSRNGEIIPNVQPHNIGEYEELRMRLAGLRTNTRIKKEFDGRLNDYLRRKLLNTDDTRVPETFNSINSYADRLGFKDLDEFMVYIKGKLVLDIGSGEGGLAKFCADQNIPAKIFSVNPRLAVPVYRDQEKTQTTDVFTGLSKDEQQVLQESHDSRAAAAFAQMLPFLGESFDVILDSYAIFYYSDRPDELQQAILELLRVLKPGGKLRMSRGYFRYPEEEKTISWKKQVLEDLNLTYQEILPVKQVFGYLHTPMAYEITKNVKPQPGRLPR